MACDEDKKASFFAISLSALTCAIGVANALAQSLPIAQTGTVIWTCHAFYLPARSIWKRTVAVDYDAEGVRSVAIDGVLVYSFSVIDNSVLTAIDGERVQFDVKKQTWTSDLRGVVSSQGRCER